MLRSTTVLHVTRDALEIAGSIVPFVGAAAVVVREITDRCDEIHVHRRKAKRMARKCLQLQNILDEQNPDRVGEEMRKKIDEAYGVYEMIRNRVQRISRTHWLVQMVNSRDIQLIIEQCEDDLEQQIKIFQLNAGLLMHKDQREAMEIQQKDFNDLKGLLMKALANKGGELAQLNELEEESTARVAQGIMLEGQQLLHQEPINWAAVRPKSEADQLMVVDVRTDSPPLLPSDSLEQQREVVQRGLIQLHELTGIPPSIKLMNGEVIRIGDLAVAGGTYSDIWQGLWLGEKKVALKALRNVKATDSKAQKRFEQEINIWASLQHKHILPFFGIVTDQGQHIQMVSPWQEFGNVLEYVKRVSNANRIHLLSGAAKGLEYLHSRNIIHGNVKCANILVSEEEEACICDFGMSKVIEDVTEKSASATLTASGSARWLAPELIEGIVTSPTKEADTYSYAMAVLELVTGKHPFSNRRRDASVIHDIVVLKKTPMRPTESEVLPWLTDKLWALMTDCWRVPATSRPSMEHVSTRITEIDGGTDKLTPILESDDVMDTSC
ncbi:Protein kinase byr2 [Termitomyces sp. T112]|nr:Protein kinase byr2 [Termitomyces sp. T112]